MSEKSSGWGKWALGCGIGCLVLIGLIVVGGGLAAYFLAPKLGGLAGEGMFKIMEGQYNEMKKNDSLPADQRIVIEEIIATCSRQDTSPTAKGFAGAVVMNLLMDQKITETELRALIDLSAFIKKNPAMKFEELESFEKDHPDIKKALDEMAQQNRFQPPKSGG